MHLRPEDRVSAARARADIPTLLLFGGAGLSAFFGGYQLLETYVLIPRFGTHTLYLMHMLRGITASILLAGFAGWYLVQHPTIVQRFDRTAGVFESRQWSPGVLRRTRTCPERPSSSSAAASAGWCSQTISAKG